MRLEVVGVLEEEGSKVKRPQRLLAILAALQSSRRTTAGELAAELGVSKRTILRDIDALAEADVPIFAERGRHGGISLLYGAEVDVHRLTSTEAEVLSLIGIDTARATQLGLEAPSRGAARKLAGRQVLPGRGDEPPRLPLDQIVVIDGAEWFGAQVQEEFSDLLEELRRGRRLRIRYRGSGQRRARSIVIDPYGLFTRGGRWYLIADVEARPRMFAMSRLGGWEALAEPRRIRPEATLESVAHDLVRDLETRHAVLVTARLDARGEDLARRILGSRLLSAEPAGGADAVIITVGYEQLDGVRQLMQFSDHIEILDPPEARDLVCELAQGMADAHRR